MINNKKFITEIKPLVSLTMGTEHMSPLLYSLIKFVRPHRLLEIGSGLSTIYILAALKELYELEKKEYNGNQTNFNLNFKNKEYYKHNKPEFILHSFDNYIHPHSNANKVQKIADKLKLNKYLKLWNTDYRNINKCLNNQEKFDFIWCDCGGLENYLTQEELLFPMLSERPGSYIIFHSTLTNVHGLAFLNQLKLKIYQGQLPGFELVSLFEPHKLQQNSCTIIRKSKEVSIYTERP
jgi:hypothetical protein